MRVKVVDMRRQNKKGLHGWKVDDFVQHGNGSNRNSPLLFRGVVLSVMRPEVFLRPRFTGTAEFVWR